MNRNKISIKLEVDDGINKINKMYHIGMGTGYTFLQVKQSFCQMLDKVAISGVRSITTKQKASVSSNTVKEYHPMMDVERKRKIADIEQDKKVVATNEEILKEKNKKEEVKEENEEIDEKYKRPPKKPTSAYVIFSTAKRKEMNRENPYLLPKDMMVIINRTWENVDRKTKQYYQEIYENEMEKYKQRLKDFNLFGYYFHDDGERSDLKLKRLYLKSNQPIKIPDVQTSKVEGNDNANIPPSKRGKDMDGKPKSNYQDEFDKRLSIAMKNMSIQDLINHKNQHMNSNTGSTHSSSLNLNKNPCLPNNSGTYEEAVKLNENDAQKFVKPSVNKNRFEGNGCMESKQLEDRISMMSPNTLRNMVMMQAQMGPMNPFDNEIPKPTPAPRRDSSIDSDVMKDLDELSFKIEDEGNPEKEDKLDQVLEDIVSHIAKGGK